MKMLVAGKKPQSVVLRVTSEIGVWILRERTE